MKINVKYFGLIAERLQKEFETIPVKEPHPINLRSYFERRYPTLKGLQYKIAVNKQLTDLINEPFEVTEIALLPPFAGG